MIAWLQYYSASTYMILVSICPFWWEMWADCVCVHLVIVKLLPEHSVIVNMQFINNYSWGPNVSSLTETVRNWDATKQ